MEKEEHKDVTEKENEYDDTEDEDDKEESRSRGSDVSSPSQHSRRSTFEGVQQSKSAVSASLIDASETSYKKKASFHQRKSTLSGGGPSSRTTSISASSRKSIKSNKSTRVSLEEMTNVDLIKSVEELQRSVRHLQMENLVFQHFLEKNEPSVLDDTQDKVALKRSFVGRRSTRQSGFFGSSFSVSLDPSLASVKEGPKINIRQKTDLVLKEMEDIEENMKKVNARCHKARHKLRAALEEMTIRENELNEQMEAFEAAFITGTSDKYPQKNPADRFARFMEETFRISQLAIDKLRLRTSSLKVQYQKICNELAQKKAIGENLQEVDFEQLQITNKHLVEKIEKRNLLLLELKKMNGKANLLLSRTKKNLLTKTESLNAIKETIKLREDMIVKLDQECDKVTVEVQKTKEEHERIKTLSENYQVPAILDYVKVKAEMAVLRKNLKVWSRRKQIKDMDLSASLRDIKHFTGSPTVDPSWFIKPPDIATDDVLAEKFEFSFERDFTIADRPKNPKKLGYVKKN